MDHNSLVRELLRAVSERESGNSIIIDSATDMSNLRIIGSTEHCELPYGKIQPMPGDKLALFREGVEVQGRPLQFVRPFRESVFPPGPNPFGPPDGVESAHALSWAHFLLGGAARSIARYEPKLASTMKDLPKHAQFDVRGRVDKVLGTGVFDCNGQQEWKAFGFIDNKSAQGCVVGSRVDTTHLPNDALLGGELFVILTLLLCKKNYYPPIAVVLSFTNTHDRVIQASIVDRKNGTPGLVVGIRYNRLLASDPKQQWFEMLRWGFWWCEEEDSDDEDDSEDSDDDGSVSSDATCRTGD